MHITRSSKHNKVVPMHHLDPFELAHFDFLGAEPGHAAGEFGAVQIANPHHITRIEFAFTTGDPGREQAFALSRNAFFAPSSTNSAPLGWWKKAIHRLRPCSSSGLRHEQGSFLFTGQYPRQHFFFLPEAITSGMPERTVIFAASTFEAIPPTAVGLSVPPASFSTTLSICSIIGIVFGSAFPKFLNDSIHCSENNEQIRWQEGGNERRKLVVVAEF